MDFLTRWELWKLRFQDLARQNGSLPLVIKVNLLIILGGLNSDYHFCSKQGMHDDETFGVGIYTVLSTVIFQCSGFG